MKYVIFECLPSQDNRTAPAVKADTPKRLWTKYAATPSLRRYNGLQLTDFFYKAAPRPGLQPAPLTAALFCYFYAGSAGLSRANRFLAWNKRLSRKNRDCFLGASALSV